MRLIISTDFWNASSNNNLPMELSWKFLIADGASDDGTRERLDFHRGRDPRIRVVDNPRRIVPAGLNAVIRQSRGDIIIRMDVHTIYAANYIAECVRALLETGADNVGGPWVASGAGYLSNAIALAFSSRFVSGGGRAHDPNYEGELDTVYLGVGGRSL